MAVNHISTIIENRKVSKDVFLLTLDFPTKSMPGQFVMIKPIDSRFDPFLARPISIFNWQNKQIELLIKIVGKGTAILSEMRIGEKIRINGPLGNSFSNVEGTISLFGGGIGIAPLYFIAKKLKKVENIVLGFRDKEDVILTKEFEQFSEVIVVTDNGSNGVKGNPATLLQEIEKKPNNIFACGPMKMMEALHEVAKHYLINDFYSLESVMGCGFGACLGCRVNTKNTSVLVCKEGPIFKGSEIF